MKRLLIWLSVIPFLTSCMTGTVWEKDSYIEHINSILMDEQNSSIVVLGESFHYIFHVDKETVDMIKACQEIANKKIANHEPQPFLISIYPFELDEKNNVTGKFVITAWKHRLSEAEWARLEKLGLEYSYIFDMNQFVAEDIKGTRYNIDKTVDYESVIKAQYNINKPQNTVKVLYPRSKPELATNALLTPVTLVADVGLFVAGSVLMSISVLINGGL